MSGLSHTPGKRARGKTLRGFESPLLRQIVSKNAPFEALFYFFANNAKAKEDLRSSIVQSFMNTKCKRTLQ